MARAMAGTGPEKSNRLFLILAVVAGLIAAVLVFAALNDGGGGSETSSAATVDVVVAGQDIPAGTRISEGMLTTASITPGSKLEGAYTSSAPLAGFVARYPISAGEQVTLGKIGLETEEKDGLSYVIPEGHRAIAVSVTKVSSVGGLLLPGDQVDVIAVFSDGQTGDGDPIAVTVLQNVEVLAVEQEAQELAPPPAGEEGEEGEEGEASGDIAQRPEGVEPQPSATTATLALTPIQAQTLALVQQEAQVILSMRPFGEEEQVELGISTLIPLTTE